MRTCRSAGLKGSGKKDPILHAQWFISSVEGRLSILVADRTLFLVTPRTCLTWHFIDYGVGGSEASFLGYWFSAPPPPRLLHRRFHEAMYFICRINNVAEHHNKKYQKKGKESWGEPESYTDTFAKLIPDKVGFEPKRDKCRQEANESPTCCAHNADWIRPCEVGPLFRSFGWGPRPPQASGTSKRESNHYSGNQSHNVGYRKKEDVFVCTHRKLGKNLSVFFKIWTSTSSYEIRWLEKNWLISYAGIWGGWMAYILIRHFKTIDKCSQI